MLQKWRELIVCNAGMWRAVYDLRGNARLKLPNGRVAHAKKTVDVRVGSKAALTAPRSDFRFTPDNGHRSGHR